MFLRDYFWPKAPVATQPDLLIDIKTVKFDMNNEQHRAYISLKMQDFVRKKDQLTNVDQQIAGAVGLCSMLYLGGLNGWLTLVGYGCVAYYATVQYDRNTLRQSFDQSLDALHELYLWCNPVAALRAPANPVARELANMIKPYVLDDIQTNKWAHLFATTKEAVTLTVYGHRFQPENAPPEQPLLR